MFSTKKIFRMLKTGPYPIGADMGEDTLRLVQLEQNGNGMTLVNGASRNRPEDVQHGSAKWQRWCAEIISSQTCNGSFRGKKIIMAMPASEVFVDHIKMPNCEPDKLTELAFEKAKQKIPFEANDAVIKCIPTEDDNVIVIATERKKIDRYLAIFEKANLQIHSIGIWPVALVNTYVTFFGRRETDMETVVMLLDIEETYTNVVICRHSNLLFARSIPIGYRQLEVNEMLSRFVLELKSCKRHFESIYKKTRPERLLFLSTQRLDEQVYTTLAKQLKMPAQIGDCLSAVEITNPSESGVDRRNCKINWSIAFGLCLSS